MGACLNDSPFAHSAKMPIRTLQVALREIAHDHSLRN